MQNTAGVSSEQIYDEKIENCSTIIEANPKLVDFYKPTTANGGSFYFLKTLHPKINLHSPSVHLFINHKKKQQRFAAKS
jgi:hypothetical protein